MRFYYPAALLALLAACASLSKEQCLTADWQAIGYNDGVRGRLESYISRHFDACSKVDITPDVQAWQAGRIQGLPLYCTPRNAYNIGRAGNDLNPVCPPEQQRSLFQSWDWGQEYYLITRQISDLESEDSAILERLSAIYATQPLTPEQSLIVAGLNDRRRKISNEIFRLEQRRQRYASAPV